MTYSLLHLSLLLVLSPIANAKPSIDSRSSCDDDLCHKPRCAEFTCYDGKCLHYRDVCNDIIECSQGEDELKSLCEIKCNADEFSCPDSRICLHNEKRCNGRRECPRGEDELGCRPTIDRFCSRDQFRCPSDGRCLSHSRRCDGRRDCPDNSDEANCPCPSGLLRCDPADSRSPCLSESRFCDKIFDCPNGLDESNCDEWSWVGPFVILFTLLVIVACVSAIVAYKHKMKKRENKEKRKRKDQPGDLSSESESTPL